MSSSWHYYNLDLDKYETDLNKLDYAGVVTKPPETIRHSVGFFTVAGSEDGPLTPERINSILFSVEPPYGYDVLTPLPVPKFPHFPSRPHGDIPQPPVNALFGFGKPSTPDRSGYDPRILDKEKRLKEKTETRRQEFQKKHEDIQVQFQAVRDKCATNDYESIRFLIKLSHARHTLPYVLRKLWEVDIDQAARILLCTFEIPDFRSLSIVKKRGKSWNANHSPVSAAERKRLTENMIYSLCLRSAYLAAKSDEGNWFDTVAVNAVQKWNDPATGQQREGIIGSIQATKAEIAEIMIDQVDAKACFRHLKGLSTPSTETVAAIRPIFVLDKNDQRIVQNKDVAKDLEIEANIAAMPWEDFEQLVRQLFEWEFGRNGVEVKVFRLSRDHGVDAVMYDPDPLRGGKYVLQAKRYTRPVDVAAVRDLYGTVVNEGANRGILVTTSSFGPDSYDFAKDKPISLVDGPNLIAMLRKHGRNYRIDLEEARRLAKLQDQQTM
jgi:restriction system protein